MARLAQAFNPQAQQPAREGSSGLPVGRHPVVIQADEIVAASSGKGHRLVFSLVAIDGPAKGHTQKYGLNLYHENPQTRQFAEGELTSLCYVTNTFQLGQQGDDTSVLWNKPFYVEIAQQKDSDKYTEVVAVYDTQGNSAMQLSQGNGVQQPQQPQQPPPPFQPAGAAQTSPQPAPPAAAPAPAAPNVSWGTAPPAAAAPATAPQPTQWQQQQPPQQSAGGGAAAPWGRTQ